MAHFAELDENNNVLRVCVVDDNIETSDGPLGENDMHVDGETWCTEFFGGTWKQTSYTNSFRKHFASHNMYYDNTKDKFMVKQPYASWSLDSNDDWQAPIPHPTTDTIGEWPIFAVWWEEGQKWLGNWMNPTEEGGISLGWMWDEVNLQWTQEEE